MHPFALKQESTKEVTGGALVPKITHGCGEEGGGIIFPPIYSTKALGEEGGEPTTLYSESGDLVPVDR